MQTAAEKGYHRDLSKFPRLFEILPKEIVGVPVAATKQGAKSVEFGLS